MKKEDNEQTRVLNAEEEKLYLLAASQPLQDIATLMLETGMRPEEVHRIRRENVRSILTVRQKQPGARYRLVREHWRSYSTVWKR